MMLDRTPSPHDDKIYAEDWRQWRDPAVPDWIDPIDVLLRRHRGAAA